MKHIKAAGYFSLGSIAALLLIAAVVSGEARETAIPDDEAGFTAYLADAFAQQLPEARVVIVGPLHLAVTPAGSGTHDLYLHNVAGGCARDRRDCHRHVAAFVENMSASIKEEAAPVERSMVRAVLRHDAYIGQARKVGTRIAGAEPIVQPFAGDLWMVCVIDLPHGIKILNLRDMKKLGLSVGEAFALAQQNLSAGLKPLEAATRPSTPEGFWVVAGDYYDASRVMLHDAWRPIANQMKGSLVVAIPTNDVLLYADSAHEQAVKSMADHARYVVSTAERPLSAALFKWTPSGWEVIAE